MGVASPARDSASGWDPVAIQPGATAFTVIPWRATSKHRDRVSPERGHARVVDQHLDVADLIDQGRYRFGIGKIRGESDGVDAMCSELESAILDSGRHGRDGDAVSRVAQSPGDGKSDSGWASGSRYESDRPWSGVHHAPVRDRVTVWIIPSAGTIARSG
jgi:hypothetical protein